MNQREIRRCKIHRRMNVLRNRYDRRILGSMTVLIAGLTVCMGILLQMAHVSGIPTVNDGYGSCSPAEWSRCLCDYWYNSFCGRSYFYGDLYSVSRQEGT